MPRSTPTPDDPAPEAPASAGPSHADPDRDERAPGARDPEVPRRTRRVRVLGLLAGLVLAVLVHVVMPGDVPHDARLTAAGAVLMGAWWMTEALPIPATALVPLVVFPVLAPDVGFDDVGASYGNNIIFLFMGGFLLALAMQRWNLHRRIALTIVGAIGTSPARLVLGFMLATAFLSMWVSNTATAVMMLPIGVSVLLLVTRLLPEETRRSTLGSAAGEAEESGGEAPADTDTGAAESEPAPAGAVIRSNIGTALMLGIAYAASIGSLATIIGTPPNALLAAHLQETFDVRIGFGRWMLVGAPLAAVLLVITWLLLTGAEAVPLGAGLLIMAASIVLSLGAERAVGVLTAPRRSRARVSTRKELVRLAAVVTAVTVPVTAAQAWTLSQSELQASYEVTPQNYPGAAAAVEGAPEAPDLRPIPLWSEVDDEWGYPGGEACEAEPEGFDDSAECYVYDPAAEDGREAERTVVLLGDSHAKQLSEPLKIAAENGDWRLVTFVYAGCRYTGHDDALAPECNDFNRAAEAAVLELEPDAVIAQGTRSQMPDQDEREIVVPHWAEGVAGFQEADIPVVSVRDNPRWGRDMFECVDLYGEGSHLCSDPVEEALGGQAIQDQWAEENPEVPLVELTDLDCPDGVCGPTVGNVMVYRDLDHVTATFGRSTAPMLEQRIVHALGW